jgi:hypothetical protein
VVYMLYRQEAKNMPGRRGLQAWVSRRYHHFKGSPPGDFQWRARTDGRG